MIIRIGLGNISVTVTSHNCHLFFVVRIFKIYCLSNFHVYNIVLLTTVTNLYIKSQEIIHVTAGSLYSLTNISPPSPLPVLKTTALSFKLLILYWSIAS